MSTRVLPWMMTSMLLIAGCASKWGLNSIEPPAALQWPEAPQRAKLTYVRALTGLASLDAGAGLVRSFVFGDEPAERNSFVLPVAVARGADGRLAVADLGRHCVHLFLPDRQGYLRLTGNEEHPLASPVGVIFDDARRLYVTDSAGRLLAFGPDGGLILDIDRAGEERLQRPTGVAYSPSRNLIYVVDTLGNRVHAFHPDGTLSFSFGSRGDEVGRFNFPTHIFRATTGELFITDALNFRVQIFDEQGQVVGNFGRHGDGSGDLALPKGVAVDRDGVVYVVDAVFDNLQLFDRQGRFLLTVGQRGADLGELWLPSGIFISGDDELYVCDTYNRRVQVYRITRGYLHG